MPRTEPAPASAPAPALDAGTIARAVVVGAIGLGSVLGVFLTPILETPAAGGTLLAGTFAAFYLAYRWDLHRERGFLVGWLGVSLALALYSAISGHLNGVTDEPYGTPAFVRLYPNLYGHALHLDYDQYGTPSSLTSAYIYLPLLTLVQVPGLDYRWLTISAWLATVYLVRRRPATAMLLASASVGLLASEGFNDFVPLFVLTLAFVTLSGGRSRVAEVVALGLKQFANVVVVLYFAWHGRWREVALALAVTAAILLPFAVLDPGGVVCHALFLNPSPTCAASGGIAFVAGGPTHLNYYLWPLWVLAVFGARYVAELRGPGYAAERAAVERRRDRPIAPTGDGRASDLAILGAPFVRLGTRLRRRTPRSDDP